MLELLSGAEPPGGADRPLFFAERREKKADQIKRLLRTSLCPRPRFGLDFPIGFALDFCGVCICAFPLSVLLQEILIVYSSPTPPTSPRPPCTNDEVYTATVLVCITDVALLMCMFYIQEFIFIIYK